MGLPRGEREVGCCVSPALFLAQAVEEGWDWLRGTVWRSSCRGLCCGIACGGSFKRWGTSSQAGLLRSMVGCGVLAAQGPAVPGLVGWGVQLLRAMQCLLQVMSSCKPCAVVCWTLGAVWCVLGCSSEDQLCSSFLLSVFLVLCFAICLSFSVSTWLSLSGPAPRQVCPCMVSDVQTGLQERIQDTSLGHFERTFIKAGDSETKERLRAEAVRLRGQ